ncbi:MAG: aldo/keto reductase [Anditalea sp.]
MKYRKLGDLEVSAVGYGAMGLSHGYGLVPDRNESINLVHFAYELGCTHFDTAEAYGAGDNELLLGEAVKPFRDKIVLATKFSLPDKPEGNTRNFVATEIRKRLKNSLNRLGTDHVELYYWHRINKTIPMEEVAQVMGELIKEGKILGWGQSQSTEDEIRKGHAVTPLTAIQSEYSIMERMFEKDVIPTCEELGIGFVPFSPLASGFLSGKISKIDEYTGDDVRRVITRFDRQNIEANQPLLDLLHDFAAAKNATPAQISLTWMLHKKYFISPIPGSRRPERIKENLGAADVELSEEEFNQIEGELEKITIHGNRTDEDIAKLKKMK